MTLLHEGNNVREFYSKLPRPVRVGIEATGSMQWFLNLMAELGIACQVGHPATIRAAEPRKQKHDRRDADLILKLLVEKRFPTIWMPSEELRDLRALLLHPHPECVAGDCLGAWFTTRSWFVELRRTERARVFAVVAAYRLSAERVAGDVREDRSGDREAEPASRGTSWPSIRSTTADDASGSRAGHGAGDRSIPG